MFEWQGWATVGYQLREGKELAAGKAVGGLQGRAEWKCRERIDRGSVNWLLGIGEIVY